MVAIFQPQYKLTINDFDVSATVSPYLISISLEDVFDLDFTVSKLDLTFHANYKRSSSWQYKDKLKLELWWSTRPAFKLVTGYFYLDYVSDVKSQGGVQTFTVSAQEADPDLGFTYGTNQLTYTTSTIRTAIFNFRDLYGLTLTHNLDLNVFMGTMPVPVTADTPQVKFDSYAEMLRYVCQTFGYFGNLSGKNLTLLKILTSDVVAGTVFTVYPLKDIYSFDFKQTYNTFAKTYSTLFEDRNNSNIITIMNYQLPMQSQLNNKVRNLEQGEAYYNYETAVARVYAAAFIDLINSFEVTINCFGLPEFAAGNLFYLDSSYGSAVGYYRCTSVRHTIDENGWNAEIKGLPLDILRSSNTNAVFKVGYTGRYQNPGSSNQFNITDDLVGTINPALITGDMLDAYAKYLNPNYNFGLGATFINEGNKTGNQIRPDLMFGIALVVTKNFTIGSLNTGFNPGNLRTTLGGSTVATFGSWTLGIRALTQRLFGYAKATETPADTIVDPAYGSIPRGSATDLFSLNGVYNSDSNFYGQVVDRVKYFYEYNFPKNTYSVF